MTDLTCSHVGSDWRDFVVLLKPRVMSLVLFTGFTGLAVAPGSLHPLLAGIAILCIAMAAGAAGAINMWYDRDIDAIMTRTRDRPIPAGRVDAAEALAFGVVLAVMSVAIMFLAANPAAAALLALSIGFYVFVYTIWLKRRTPQNIVIGGAAGAFPPMIGWAAVTGDIGLGAWLLFAIIFLWTPPHFWALALYRAGDYQAAGVPMLPVIAGDSATKRQMLAYTALMALVSLMPAAAGMAGLAYSIGAGLLGALFLIAAIRVWQSPPGDDRPARQMFGFSIFYLFALFALLLMTGAP